MRLVHKHLFVLLGSAIAISASVAPQPAHAEWGCEVLLCLANPAGPMAAPACVPPITRLYRAIFKTNPDPFPTCTMVDGNNSATAGNYATVVADSYYDACPDGLTALPAGSFGATGTYVQRTSYYPFGPGYEITGSVLTGFGENTAPEYSNETGPKPMPPKACVGQRIGQAVFYPPPLNREDQADAQLVTLYGRLVILQPASSAIKFNIFVDNKLYHSVRPGF